jgi:hypothetical protein
MIFAMREQLRRGQSVKVRAYGGEILERIVVTDLGRTVIVSNEQDSHGAARENREPDGIGFPRKDVLLLGL